MGVNIALGRDRATKQTATQTTLEQYVINDPHTAAIGRIPETTMCFTEIYIIDDPPRTAVGRIPETARGFTMNGYDVVMLLM